MTGKPKLTAKQERFCELIALEGMTQADAYREAYDCAKMKPETIWARASELMADSKVSGWVESLKAEVAKATVKKTARTREQLLEKLDRVFDDAMDGDRKAHSAAVSAIGTQAKLLGFDVQRVELSGDLEIRAELEHLRKAKEMMGQLTTGQKLVAAIAGVNTFARESPEDHARELLDLIDRLAKLLAGTSARADLVEACKRVLSELEGYTFD